MIIQLLMVGGLIMFLHSSGFIDVGSLSGMMIAGVLALLPIVFGVIGVHVAAHVLADNLFGFKAWSGGRVAVAGRDIPNRLPPNPTLDLLRKRAAKWPKDLGASRDLADALARGGHHHLAIAERRRFLDDCKKVLSPSEIITIVYRMADSLIALGNLDGAVDLLRREVIDPFPEVPEAEFAKQRIDNILAGLNNLP